jgi:hypothetical protein
LKAIEAKDSMNAELHLVEPSYNDFEELVDWCAMFYKTNAEKMRLDISEAFQSMKKE